MKRYRLLLLLSAGAVAYLLTRRSTPDGDIWADIEKDWYG